ncbi:hypothetical protein AB6A40_000310 [Gnathostoma spinigerum]|uniref:Uncharacterized protein n=1 Tax=Gnathostoma spinigerum TaxID=75299 RepID=A0ABD6E8C5_9BILA
MSEKDQSSDTAVTDDIPIEAKADVDDMPDLVEDNDCLGLPALIDESEKSLKDDEETKDHVSKFGVSHFLVQSLLAFFISTKVKQDECFIDL